MRSTFLLVIVLTAIVFYGILPIVGAFFNRHRWKQFRGRFCELFNAPLLDYRQYRQLESKKSLGDEDVFRYIGEIESITDGRTLWVKSEDLTIPVSLEKTNCFLLPTSENEGASSRKSEAPQKIKWNHLSTVTEGTKVFIGGRAQFINGRLSFKQTKQEPLTVIFYNCPDTELKTGIIRSARTGSKYWNNFTLLSLIIGVFILVIIANTFLGRPAYRITVIASLIAIFIPIMPVLPPGFLFTFLYRRLLWNAGKLRIDSELISFGIKKYSAEYSARRYLIRSYITETFAWLVILLAICINITFIFIILFQLRIISV